MNHPVRPWSLLLLLWTLSGTASSEPCTGRMINPLTDFCWECVLPVQIEAPGACACPAPPPQFVRFGIVFSFWEPVWLVDVPREPFCFTNLGFQASFGGMAPAGYISTGANSRGGYAFYQLHIYENFFWSSGIGQTVSASCRLMYSGGPNYSVEWFTEFDPLWNDDSLAAILAPEAALFANPVAQVACAADCVAATAARPLDALFWCAGCQGSLYPFSGHTSEQDGGIMASTLLSSRMIAKMHRQGLAWDTTTNHCGNTPAPVIKKSQYQLQVTRPIPNTVMGCATFGASEVPYAVGQEIPVTGEDFGYLVWRKRKCCVSN